jgi:hypothetical protein
MKECDCVFPERRAKDGACSEEQIAQCQADKHKQECDCPFPERRPKDGPCSPELIERCHGGGAGKHA